jgi:hypothetical protein
VDSKNWKANREKKNNRATANPLFNRRFFLTTIEDNFIIICSFMVI